MNNEENQAALAVIKGINAVEGFDPTPLAVEYADLNTGEKRLRLPVMAQLAWFRLKYPEGRIAVSVTAGKDCFIATARVYNHFTAPVDQFLAEATASRGYLADKPTVSPREWAQTAAVGIALRNAGFGLQFGAAGDSNDTPTVKELDGMIGPGPSVGAAQDANAPSAHTAPAAAQPDPPAATETPLERAMKMQSPIKKHGGKTLGEVLNEEPGAIIWLANKYTRDAEISAAAKLICECAIEATA